MKFVAPFNALKARFASASRSTAAALIASGTKPVAALLVLALVSAVASAQSERWAWMGGASRSGQSGVYHTLGKTYADNIPGSRYSAISWADAAGNFWLFGGRGFDSKYNFVLLNDLWKYSPATQMWTWVSGSDLVVTGLGKPGAYGSKGKASSTNVPGGRAGAVSWTDSSGHFWLFGGDGIDSTGKYGTLNDLWEFSPATGQWTWASGSSTVGMMNAQSGVYGALGKPDPANVPGSRDSAHAWADASGNLWLFGGFGVDGAGTLGDLNDLWEFNTTTRQWAWIAGSNSVYKAGVYGVQGVPGASNIPGSRYSAQTWTDLSGNFWLFGGYGLDETGDLAAQGVLNDLWEFSPANGQWDWIGGRSTGTGNSGSAGIYGTLGTPAVGNQPGSRNSGVTWTDLSGNLWLFGGAGLDSAGNSGFLNDIWRFTPSLGTWTWMGGNTTLAATFTAAPGSYGTLGASDSTTVPPGHFYSVPLNPNGTGGNLWLFGGASLNNTSKQLTYLNDIWEYQLTAVNTPVFTPGAGTYSTQQKVAISDTQASTTIYYTTDGKTTPTAKSTKYSTPITVSSTETIQAIATASGYATSNVGSAAYTLQTAAPAFSPAVGSYTTIQSVSITDPTPGTAIYYTTDGVSTPTASSTKFSAPVKLSQTTTIKAIGIASGFANSTVSTATYTINLPQAATPAFSVSGGTYSATQSVKITDATSGATIYYTTNGAAPTTASTKYTAPIAVSTTETLQAIAVATGYTQSATASAAYTIQLPTTAPVFSPAAGTYTAVQSVKLTNGVTGSTIYYTINGTVPTTASTVYSAPIAVTSTTTIKAIATTPGRSQSTVASATYTLNLPAAAPTFSPAAGSYAGPLTVTLSDSTPSAVIYYTVNGTTPTTSSSKYTAALTLTASGTVKAFATAPGWTPSPVSSAAYTVTLTAAAPTITTAAAQNGASIVTLRSKTTGSTVHYTIDGTTPTSASPVFQANILIASNLTLNAIATAPGFAASPVTTQSFAASIPSGTLVWADEFTNTGSANAQPNSSTWTYDTGAGGWGNNELENYCSWGSNASPCTTASPNAYVGTDSALHIVERKTSSGAYTSARMKSQGQFSMLYGRLEVRAQVPEGQGFWPAIWLLGNNISTVSWPACGELDMVERVDAATTPDWNAGSVHGTGFTGANLGTNYHFPAGQTAAGWHTYGMIWSPGSISYYVDSPSNIYATYTPASLKGLSGAAWPFDSGNGAFLIINVAVGGSWPGNPTSSTTFPSEMLVDYVRIYAN